MPVTVIILWFCFLFSALATVITGLRLRSNGGKSFFIFLVLAIVMGISLICYYGNIVTILIFVAILVAVCWLIYYVYTKISTGTHNKKSKFSFSLLKHSRKIAGIAFIALSIYISYNYSYKEFYTLGILDKIYFGLMSFSAFMIGIIFLREDTDTLYQLQMVFISIASSVFVIWLASEKIEANYGKTKNTGAQGSAQTKNTASAIPSNAHIINKSGTYQIRQNEIWYVWIPTTNDVKFAIAQEKGKEKADTFHIDFTSSEDNANTFQLTLLRYRDDNSHTWQDITTERKPYVDEFNTSIRYQIKSHLDEDVQLQVTFPANYNP